MGDGAAPRRPPRCPISALCALATTGARRVEPCNRGLRRRSPEGRGGWGVSWAEAGPTGARAGSHAGTTPSAEAGPDRAGRTGRESTGHGKTSAPLAGPFGGEACSSTRRRRRTRALGAPEVGPGGWDRRPRPAGGETPAVNRGRFRRRERRGEALCCSRRGFLSFSFLFRFLFLSVSFSLPPSAPVQKAVLAPSTRRDTTQSGQRRRVPRQPPLRPLPPRQRPPSCLWPCSDDVGRRRRVCLCGGRGQAAERTGEACRCSAREPPLLFYHPPPPPSPLPPPSLPPSLPYGAAEASTPIPEGRTSERRRT